MKFRYFRFFPAAGRVAQTFPTVDQTVATLSAVGFRLVMLRRVHEQRDGTLTDWATRVRAMRHADSTLASLSNAEFASGLSALETAATAGEDVPQTGLDLLVLQ